MKLLAIETSTEYASVALIIDQDIFSQEQSAKHHHAQCLLPMVAELLKNADCTLNQLDGIVYGRGPGSFTGIRIACSIAKGLAYAHDLPLFPVSSLAAIGYEAWYQNQNLECHPPILTMLDARMNQVYWALFSKNIPEIKEFVSSVSLIDIPLEQNSFILAGVGFEPYLSFMLPSMRAKMSKQCFIYPHAKTMVRIALSGAIKAVPAAEAKPVYVRNQITQSKEN